MIKLRKLSEQETYKFKTCRVLVKRIPNDVNFSEIKTEPKEISVPDANNHKIIDGNKNSGADSI